MGEARSNRTEQSAHSNPPGRRYFLFATASLLLLTIWGFSDNLLWRVDQPSNRDPKFIVHGVMCLAWMMLLVLQASLVRRRQIEVHRRIGVAAMLLAIGVVVSTAYVFWEVRRPWSEMTFLVQGNRLLLVGFGLLVFLAYRNRRRPAWHKRYVLLGSLFMLEPVLSRGFDPIEPLLTPLSEGQINVAWWMFFLSVWNGLLLTLFAYDRRMMGRVHVATLKGAMVFYGVWATVLLF